MEKKWISVTGWEVMFDKNEYCGNILKIGGIYFPIEEAESLANWILETLPKKRYQVNKTFEFKPTHVSGILDEFFPRTNIILEEEDIKEVWE